MISWIIRAITVLGVIALWTLTLCGLLALIYPPADLVNHFRPFIIFAGICLATLSILIRSGVLTKISLAGLSCNLALMGMAWTNSAAVMQQAQASSEPGLKLITFNILIKNQSLDKAVDFLKRENADIVLFQEFGPHHTRLLKKLKTQYPYQLSCPEYCNLAMISRHPWDKAGTLPGELKSPALIYSDYTNSASGKRFRIVGVHIAWPFRPYRQDVELEWLADFINTQDKPVIVVGDFNHTPWSWRLNRFTHRTQMKRHATFLASWPARIPVFLIDHILSSKQISAAYIRTGPDLNSDHLPIISKLTFQ